MAAKSSQQVTWMSSFAIIHASLLFDLKRKYQGTFHTFCSVKKSHQSRILDALSRYAEWHHFVLMSTYAVSCVKYTLIIIIKWDLFESLRWLDCFLVGRMTFVGRTSVASPFLALGLYLVLMFYRSRMAKVKPRGPFRFFVYEFLVHHIDDISAKQIQGKPEEQQNWPMEHQYLLETSRLSPLDRVLYLQNHFPSSGDRKFILRPNRTPTSWLILAKCAKLSLSLALISTMASLPLLHYILAGNLLTNMGFELNYRICAGWLREKQQNGSHSKTTSNSNRTLAYEIEMDRLPFFVPVEDFVEMSLYSSVRILFDFVENYLWYMDFWLTFISFSFNSHLICLDMIINVTEIKKTMAALVERMSLSSSSKKHTKQLDVDICRIQATLLDHLVMVRGYSSYVSFYLSICMYLWFQQSCIICSWMGATRSKAVELEFAWIEALTFMIIMFLLSGPAILKNISHDLYRLISRAAVLDSATVRKKRWASIIQYFYPHSEHCFVLFGSSQISWLFCLKLLSWIVSAVLVLANFFYMQRGPP